MSNNYLQWIQDDDISFLTNIKNTKFTELVYTIESKSQNYQDFLEGYTIHRSGNSLFHLAAYFDSINCFAYIYEILKSESFDPFYFENGQGYTPIHFSILGNATHVLQYILSIQSNVTNFVPRANLKSFMMCAIISRNIHFVKLLIKVGFETTPAEIEKAIKLNCFDILNVLLLSNKSSFVPDMVHETRISLAIKYCPEAIPVLISFGDDPNVYSVPQQRSDIPYATCPLKLATGDDSLKYFVHILSKMGKKIDPPAEFNSGPNFPMIESFPVHWICSFRNTQLLQYALENKEFNVNARTLNSNASCIDKLLPLDNPKNWDPTEFLKQLDLLILHGFDINRVERKKNTNEYGSPFKDYLLSNLYNVKVIRFFLVHGLDINIENSFDLNKTIKDFIYHDDKWYYYFHLADPTEFSY